MSVRQYIGARYVTKIYENSLDPSSAEWEQGTFEPLVMVTWLNSTYLSKKQVPGSVGNPADNPDYWVCTGYYNGQILSLQQQIDDINAELVGLQRGFKRVIMLGDSYANRVNLDGKTYFDLIKTGMNFSDDDFYHNNVAGASFHHSVPEGRFIYLLQQLENSVSDPDTITDIIVVCGANDANYTYSDTSTAIASFVSYCDTQYPDAKISIIGLGLTFTNAICTALRDVTLKAFRDAAVYKVNFVENSQYVLRDSLLLESDVCHPNASGVDAIASACIEFLNKNCINVIRSVDYSYDSNTGFSISLFPDYGATINNPVISFTALENNGVMKIYSEGSNGTIAFSTNINITFSANDKIICNLPHRIFYGYTPTGGSYIYHKCFLVNLTTFEKLDCSAFIRSLDNAITLELFIDQAASNAGYQYFIEWTPELIQ